MTKSRNFEFVQPLETKLYEYCCRAESLVKTDPDSAGAAMRVALEYMMQWICHRHELKRSVTYEMINRAGEARVLSEPHLTRLHGVRWIGNRCVHSDFKALAEPDKAEEWIDNSGAVGFLRDLHSALVEYARKMEGVEPPPFQSDKLPIQGRYPIRELSLDGEACQAKYLCEYDEAGSRSYCVIKEFDRRLLGLETGFALRDHYTLRQRWISDTAPQNIVRYSSISVQESNDLFFTCYELGREEPKELGEFLAGPQALQDKLALIAGIGNGIMELHANEEPIIHRFLTPGCIYLMSGRGGRLVPKISNFEYSKLDNPLGVTMIDRVRKRADAFKAPELALGADIEFWPAVDVYSFGMIILHMFGHDVTHVYEPEKLQYSGLSKSFCKLLSQMVSPAAAKRPGIEEVLLKIRKEAAR